MGLALGLSIIAIVSILGFNMKTRDAAAKIELKYLGNVKKKLSEMEEENKRILAVNEIIVENNKKLEQDIETAKKTMKNMNDLIDLRLTSVNLKPELKI